MIDLSSSLVDGFQKTKPQGFMDLKGALDDLAGELLVLHLEEKTKDKDIFGTDTSEIKRPISEEKKD